MLIWIGRDDRRQFGMQLRRLFAQFQHVAKNGNAPALAVRGCCGQKFYCGAHRCRVGVIALINQCERAFGDFERVTRAASALRPKDASAKRNLGHIRARQVSSAKHCKDVLHDMPAWCTNLDDDFLARKTRCHARTFAMQFKLDQTVVGSRIFAESS